MRITKLNEAFYIFIFFFLLLVETIITVITEKVMYYLFALVCIIFIGYKLLRFYEDLEFEKLEIEYSESGLILVDMLGKEVMNILTQKTYYIHIIICPNETIGLVDENRRDIVVSFREFQLNYRLIEEIEKDCMKCKNKDKICEKCYNFSHFEFEGI